MKVNILRPLVSKMLHSPHIQALQWVRVKCLKSRSLPFLPFVWTVPLDGGDSCWRSDFYSPLHFFSPFIVSASFHSLWKIDGSGFFFFCPLMFFNLLKNKWKLNFSSSEEMGGGRGMSFPLSLTHTPACRERWCVQGDSLTAVKQHSWSPLMWAGKTCRRLPICLAPELWQWSIIHARTHTQEHGPFTKLVTFRPSNVSRVLAVGLCDVRHQHGGTV